MTKMKAKILLWVYFLYFFSLTSCAEINKKGSARLYLWNLNKIESVKNDSIVYKQLVSMADAINESKIVKVTDKEYSFSGNKHNYESLSFYAWPDSTKKNGVPWKIRDGIINPIVYKYDLTRIYSLGYNTECLAIAYYVTGNKKYYNQYVEQIRKWFIDEATYMYPNFDYIQILPGYNGNRGNKWGITDACSLNAVLESIRLVSIKNSYFRKNMLPKLEKWFISFGNWLDTSDIAIAERNMGNNQAIVFDELYINIAIFTKRKLKLQKGRDAFLSHLHQQIEANSGKQPKELKRTRAYHYSGYNLTHIVDIMIMLQNCNLPLDMGSFALVEKSFDFIRCYKDNENTFPYQNITNDWNQDSQALEEDYDRFLSLKKNRKRNIKRYTTVMNSIIK